MGPKPWLAVVAALVLAALAWMLLQGDDDLPSQGAPMAAAHAGEPTAPAAVAVPRAESERVPAAPSDVPIVRGTVVDQDGVWIRGAKLRLLPAGARSNRATPLSTSGSDVRGRFEFAILPAWTAPFTLEAEAPGAAMVVVHDVVPERAVEVRLLRLVVLFGVVREAGTDLPIAGAMISDGKDTATADATGHYELNCTRAGLDTSLTARCEGFCTESLSATLREPVRTQFDIVLQRSISLTVQVVDRDSGAPIADAEVRRFRMGRTLTRSDSEGRFLVTTAEGKQLDVALVANGYCPLTWSWTVQDGAAAKPRLSMMQPATIAGRVVDSERQALPGALVMVHSGSGWMNGRPVAKDQLQALATPGTASDELPAEGAQCDASGHFELLVFPDASPQCVSGHLEDHVNATSQPVVVATAGARAFVELVLPRGGSIRGSVACNGKPWVGDVLCIPTGQAGGLGVQRADIDAEGHYLLRGVTPGAVELTVRKGYSGVKVQSVQLSVAAGQETRRDFVWDEAMDRISGRVTHARGEPLGRVTVFANAVDEPAVNISTRTAPDGSYVLEVTPPHAYAVSARRGVVTQRRDAVAANATDVDFVFPDFGRLRLRLLDAATRQPAHAANGGSWTIAWRMSGDAAYQDVRGDVDVQGIVDLELPIGTVDVAVSMQESGYSPRQCLGLPVATGPAPAPVDVELQRGVEARIEFRGPRPFGAAAKDHLVFLLEPSQLTALRGPFPDQGGSSNHRINGVNMWVGEPGLMHQLLNFSDPARVELRGLRPGTYSLRAFPDDFAFTPSEVVVGAEGGVVTVMWNPR